MSVLAQFIKLEILLLLAGFIAVVLFRLFTGKIKTRKLLSDKGTNTLSSARIQQLVFTLLIAFYYLYLTFKNPSAFPKIDTFLLYLLAGSSTVYLSGKARLKRWIRKKIRD
jgi:hypothetical protein